MSGSFQYDAFLSHNKADKPEVWRLAERLGATGFGLWFDGWIIKLGNSIYLAIERGLAASRTAVLCLSPASLGSEWVGLERSTVMFRDPANAGRRFIPLLRADCKLPDALRRYKHLNFQTESDGCFADLLSACKPTPELSPAGSQPLGMEKSDQQQSKPCTHVESSLGERDRLKLRPQELCARLSAIPPLQVDEAKKPYLGFWVDWLTTLSSGFKHVTNPELYALQLSPTQTKADPAFSFIWIHCVVKPADFPTLRVLPTGGYIRVTGQIVDLTSSGVTLANVKLEFQIGRASCR